MLLIGLETHIRPDDPGLVIDGVLAAHAGFQLFTFSFNSSSKMDMISFSVAAMDNDFLRDSLASRAEVCQGKT